MKNAEDLLRLKGSDIISVSPGATVFEALKVMAKHKIGAVLVKKDDTFLGIWTERDLVRNFTKPGFDPKTANICDYMVTGIQSSPYTDTIYKLLDKFLGLRMRHLLIEKEGKFIGILSARDVTRACLVEKTKELKELNDIVSLDYYENWKWKKKK